MNDKILHMRIPGELYDAIKALAKKKNISLASIVRIILTEYLERNE